MNPELAISQIGEFRDQLRRFQETETPDPAFYQCRERTLNALEEIFGRSSNEYCEFERLRFEISPIRTSDFEERVRQLSGWQEIDADTSRYFHQRLYEADEMLLGCIIALRKRLD